MMVVVEGDARPLLAGLSLLCSSMGWLIVVDGGMGAAYHLGYSIRTSSSLPFLHFEIQILVVLQPLHFNISAALFFHQLTAAADFIEIAVQVQF